MDNYLDTTLVIIFFLWSHYSNIIKLQLNKNWDTMEIDVIEEEIQIYNSRMRLLSWLYDELTLQPNTLREELNKKGQELPINS